MTVPPGRGTMPVIADDPNPSERQPADASGGDRSDPVRIQRARWQAAANLGQRIGYLLIGVAIVAFALGLALEFTDLTTWIVGLALAAATLTLAPAMVIGYAVKAAEREDRAQGR